MFKQLTFIVAFFIFISCGTPVDKQTPAAISQNIDSTSLLLVNLKKSRPYFKLKLDSSLVDTTQYSTIYNSDTTKCHSFRFNKVFLGKLNMAKASVLEYGSSKTLYLQTGNLNLWVCNLPQHLKSGDTVFISGLVYDILGFEKTRGLPTILMAIRIKPAQSPLSKT